MNEYQTKIFRDLNHLCETNEAFFSNDWELDGLWYRNFAYRLASYTDFGEPSALESRGIMFEIYETGEAIRLASHPFSKFFNLNENPYTMDLDLSTIVEIADKADGSLISTYMHNDILRVKTKGSLHSDQAVAVKSFLYQKENCSFRGELYKAEELGYTVIMEWCALENRIVLPYETPHLKVLGVRLRADGSYVNFNDINSSYINFNNIDAALFPEIKKRWTKIITTDDPEVYINSVDDMQQVEGVVFRLASGQRVKVKTNWYVNLHKNKDNINSPKKLFEAVVYETSDDLKSLFHDDELTINIIIKMEKHVSKIYNHVITTIEKFHTHNKHLERKEYAILGQTTLTKPLFSLAMMKYLNKEIDYKKHMVKCFDIYKPVESTVEVPQIED